MTLLTRIWLRRIFWALFFVAAVWLVVRGG